MLRYVVFGVGCWLLAPGALAQRKPAPAPVPPPLQPITAAPVAQGDKVELLPGAEELEVIKLPNGTEVRKVKKNVSFRQRDTYLYCDSAYMYPLENVVRAFSNVRIVQGDTVNVRGDSLNYNGNTRYARMRGNVVLQDRAMTLTTPSADYDLGANTAYYFEGGRIVDKDNVLTSKQGQYNTRTKLFTFKKDVVVVNPERTLTTDTLNYNSATRVAYLKGPSKIVGRDGIMYAQDGEYDTRSQVSNFRSRAKIDYGKYTLEGDRLYYDRASEVGYAQGNVISFSKQDNATVYGDFGQYFGKRGLTKVYGNALMQNVDDARDTLFLAADTLVSVERKTDTTKYILGYPNVKIFKDDMQGKCDSLVYNLADSTLYFFRDPVLWSSGNQMEADSMRVQMANKKISRMYLRVNSFVISQDSIQNYNQIKGRILTASFNAQSKIERVFVEGNAESLYFVLGEGDSLLVGMNRVECSKMDFRFRNNKMKQVAFLTKPDALLVPPHELEEPDKRLKGFAWREKERPTRAEVESRRRRPPPRI